MHNYELTTDSLINNVLVLILIGRMYAFCQQGGPGDSILTKNTKQSYLWEWEVAK